MDPLLRGVCEQYIDCKLADGEIEKIKALLERLDLPTKSREDAALGVFLGIIYSQIDNHYMLMYNRFPSESEVEDYNRILQRRAPEIRARFMEWPEGSEIDSTGQDCEDDYAEEEQVNDDRFSFDTTARSQQITNILGIPTR